MTQSTIDSEVEQILTEFSDGLDFVLEVDANDIPAHDKDFFDRPYLDAKTAITNLIAQAANKARKELLLKLKQAPPIDWLDANASIDQWLAELDAKITADKEPKQ